MPNPEYTQQEVDNLFGLQASQIASGVQRIAKLEAAVAAIQGSPTTPTPPPPPPPAGVPFAPTSNWNTKIPVGANYADFAPMHVGGGWVNSDAYSAPLVVSKNTDPLVTINFPAAGSWGWPSGSAQLHVPSDVTGAAGTDGALCIVDGTTVWSFWQFSRSGNVATCASYAKCQITDSGWGSGGVAAGIHASGSSLLAGLITGTELTTGIFHATAIGCRTNIVNGSTVNGAISSDGGGSGAGSVPNGSRFAIPRPTAKPANLSPQGSILWNSMVDYGTYIIDTNGGDQHAAIWWADPRSVPAADVSALVGANWTAPDLGAILAAARRVL